MAQRGFQLRRQFGSQAIAGLEKASRGRLLELSWNGAARSFVEHNDTLTLRGTARGDGYSIGFGDRTGKVIAVLPDLYAR